MTWHPPLERAQQELKKAEEGGVRALWHLCKALGILVEYLRAKESQ